MRTDCELLKWETYFWITARKTISVNFVIEKKIPIRKCDIKHFEDKML